MSRLGATVLVGGSLATDMALSAHKRSPSPALQELVDRRLRPMERGAAALVLVLSIFNVFARDTQHLLELALIAFFWALPIIYEYMRVTKWLGTRHVPTWLPLVNPITSIIITFQRALYGTATAGSRALLPDESAWWYLRNIGVIAAASLVLLALVSNVPPAPWSRA